MMQPMQKERQTVENAASKLLSLALKAGATSAEVCATYGLKTKITLEKQDYHMASSDDGYQFGLRVMLGQRQGFSSGNSLDPQDLKDIATKAVEIGSFSPENPHYGIQASDNIPKEAPSEAWDNALHQLSLQTQKDWTKLMVEEATKDPRFRLNEGGVTISESLFLVLNSQGTHKLERESRVDWSLMGMAVDGEKITSFDHLQQMARQAAGTPDRIWASTRSFRDQMLQSLNQGPAKSYRGLVLFSPRAVIDIFLSPLSHHLNGRSVLEGTGRWNKDHLGNIVLNPSLHLTDRPWLTDRSSCSVFDREGTPTRELPLIEAGMLRHFLLDHYAAKGLYLKSTGNAVGGPSTTPAVSAHCLCLAGGAEPLRDLTHRLSQTQPEFLLVRRFSGQTDPVTGDFSGVAKGGEWWRGSERSHFVQETLISGNLFDAFGSGLFGISRETEIVECAEESPTLAIDAVSVTTG